MIDASGAETHTRLRVMAKQIVHLAYAGWCQVTEAVAAGRTSRLMHVDNRDPTTRRYFAG